MPTLAEINRYTPQQFSSAFGTVYEHSPWIAERAFARRPFASPLDLQLALYGVVQGASDGEKLALIRAPSSWRSRKSSGVRPPPRRTRTRRLRSSTKPRSS